MRLSLTGACVSGEFVVLREFSDEMSARLAAMVLEANGVEARVMADTAGGALPSLAIVFPVRVLVPREDEALARELLDTDVDDEEGQAGDAVNG